MRPVRLEMDGFASFRSPAVVDFDGADYFALVGPTGSGKSTVLDAMVFALFGTAPRWDRANAIRYALAPTGTRAVVRLVFDVGPNRYQIAREVRRSGKAIQQKSASLEKFDNPNQPTATTDEVTVLASEASSVTPVVESLLGLTFEDFTKAVVLPQGRFAEFLGAKASQRQEILLKLLGAHQYDLIMQAAGRHQTEATLEQVELNAQLVELADATPEAEAATKQRLAGLTELAEETAALLTQQSEAQVAAQQATQAIVGARLELKLLGTVLVPEDLSDLHSRTEALRAELATLTSAEAAAATAHAEARESLQEAGNRTELERLRRDWNDLEAATTALPGLTEAAAGSEEALSEAKQAQSAASEQWGQAVNDESAARQALQQAEESVSSIQRERALVAAITMPDGVADLAQRLDQASEDVTRTSANADTAQVAHEALQASQAELGDESEPKLLLAHLDRFGSLQAEVLRLSEAVQQLLADQQAEQSKLNAASAEVTRLQTEVDDSAARTTAAELRHQLTAGDNCPVCEQVVSALPPAIDLAEVDELRRQLQTAKVTEQFARTTLDATTQNLVGGARELSTRETELENLRHELSRSQSESDAAQLRADLERSLAEITAAKSAAATAFAKLAGLRRLREDAVAAQTALQQERDNAWTTLQARRASVLTLGAPAHETGSIAQAWQELEGWVASHLTALEMTRLPQAQTQLAERGQLHEEAVAKLSATKAERDRTQSGLEQAGTANATATAALTQARGRHASLTQVLIDAPDSASVTAQLTHLDALESDEQQALRHYQDARKARESADADQRALEEEVKKGWQTLRSTRDPLVKLGAPDLGQGDLAAGWAKLAEWAGEAQTAIQDRLVEQDTSLQAATNAVRTTEEQVIAAFRAHQIDIDEASQADKRVASEAALARRELESTQHGRLRRAKLDEKLKVVQEKADVASMLARNLDARRFQRWLAEAAMDRLIESASESLFELSGKQFGLTHENGEFFVIDYADAEAKRSVRTLSGGETFQASLALALALSQEFSSISSNAIALDSIFLDEGFGSLDPDSLEVVAVTLERLAQGERMVGIVTHVQGLAERIPTRFVVSRNSRTSNVTREG